MAHTCPQCGCYCTCKGDWDDIDLGHEPAGGCVHYLDPDCDCNHDGEEDYEADYEADKQTVCNALDNRILNFLSTDKNNQV